MKQHMTLNEMAAELTRQEETKRDFIADTRKLHMAADGETLEMFTGDGIKKFGVTNHAHRQLGSRLQIPAKYYDRLRVDHPDLLAANINHLFKEEHDSRMIRTLDNTARAFLSDRYRPLDNFDLAHAVLPVLKEIPDIRFESCSLDYDRLYIKAVFPRMEAELAKGDVVQSGIVITNSEVGKGRLKVEPLVFRLVCLNGMISQDYGFKKNHVGRAADAGEDAFELFRDETLAADDRAFWLKVQDIVRATVDEAQFAKITNAMKRTMDMKIKSDPVEVVERVQKHFNMNDDERGGILRHLIDGGDLSAYGMLNAITRTSQDIDSYDRATDFERMGGQIIELSNDEWKKLAA